MLASKQIAGQMSKAAVQVKSTAQLSPNVCFVAELFIFNIPFFGSNLVKVQSKVIFFGVKHLGI